MKEKVLYQTLQDRGNIKEILDDAPYLCNWENTWLGKGFYFWDTFIDIAHWWGKIRYKKNYIICRFICEYDISKCFDLVGETDHMIDFSKAIDFLKQKKLVDENTTVSRVISFMRNSGSFNYEAIRVFGINSIDNTKCLNRRFVYRIMFEKDKIQYLDYKPAIQICIFEKTGLNLSKASIEFPAEYIPGYLI